MGGGFRGCEGPFFCELCGRPCGVPHRQAAGRYTNKMKGDKQSSPVHSPSVHFQERRCRQDFVIIWEMF